MNYQERIYKLLTEVGKPESAQVTAPGSWDPERHLGGAARRISPTVPPEEVRRAKARLGIKPGPEGGITPRVPTKETGITPRAPRLLRKPGAGAAQAGRRQG